MGGVFGGVFFGFQGGGILICTGGGLVESGKGRVCGVWLWWSFSIALERRGRFFVEWKRLGFMGP